MFRRGRKRRQLPDRHKKTLEEQIEDPNAYGVRTKPTKKQRRKHNDSDDEEEFVPGALSARILKEARAQQDEVDNDTRPPTATIGITAALKNPDLDSDDDDEYDPDGPDDFSDPGSQWEEYNEDDELEEISPEDEAALAAFMAPNAADYQQKTLTDIILEKIREKQQEAGLSEIPREGEEHEGGGGERVSICLPSGLSPKVVKVYQDVGVLLSRYTSGKIPKAFKIVPNLSNWEEILYITEPENWTPHAVYQATRLFVSNLNNRLAQRFLALVLLPAFRADIRNNRRLHFAHFQALKKATYKAGAFYKGILIPLCSSGTCTLREAVILSSVIKRASIPVLHSAAALLRLAELPYCGTTSFFMRVLLDKKYALPYRVIDAMVDHFISFQREERQLPVVWHQALLCFVQRYKSEIREEDKDVLRALCKRQHHYLVSAEVVRELDAAARASRGSGGAMMSGSHSNDNNGNYGNSQQYEQVGSIVGKHVMEDPRDLAPIIMDD